MVEVLSDDAHVVEGVKLRNSFSKVGNVMLHSQQSFMFQLGSSENVSNKSRRPVNEDDSTRSRLGPH